MNATATITFEQAPQAKALSKPKTDWLFDALFRIATGSSVAAIIYFTVTNLIG